MSPAAAIASGHYCSPEDDVVLDKLVQAGGTKALENLIRKHSGRVLIIIHRITEGCGTRQDVEDLADEVFYRAWHSIGECDPGISIAKWINVLAKQTAISYRREVGASCSGS